MWIQLRYAFTNNDNANYLLYILYIKLNLDILNTTELRENSKISINNDSCQEFEISSPYQIINDIQHTDV